SVDEKILGDIQTYPLPNDLDAVVCWDVLEHLPEPDRALRNFFQAVKPGGVIVVKSPNTRSLKALVTKLTPLRFHTWYYRRLLRLLAGHRPDGTAEPLLGLGLSSLGQLPLPGLPVFGDGVLLDLHPDVPVPAHAGTRRDELADDDVLLQTEQRIAPRADGRLREHARGLLERRRRQPRVGGQRGLGDPHEDRARAGGQPTVLHDLGVRLLEALAVDELTGKELGVARLDDVHLPQHLPDDQLDVLVVDRHALRPVDL